MPTASWAGTGAVLDARRTAIHYPDAFVDETTGELVSDAEVAEVADHHPWAAVVHDAARRLRHLITTPAAAPG